MKKLSIFNNILITIFIGIDLFYLFRNFDINNLSYILICLSFILIILLPKIIRNVFKVNFSLSLEFISIIFVILALFFGSILHFYDKIYWYDSFTHFLSGVLTALFALVIINTFKQNKKVLFNILFIISFSMLVATFWEIFEFISNMIFHSDPQKVLTTGVNDTMKDIICALSGSALFIIVYLYDFFKNKKLIKSIVK